jgi:hypothetical protein
MEEKIEKADERLESLRVRAGRIQQRNLTRERRQLELLDQQRAAIREDMLVLKEREGTAWEALRIKIEQAVKELEEGIEDLAGQLTESEEEES